MADITPSSQRQRPINQLCDRSSIVSAEPTIGYENRADFQRYYSHNKNRKQYKAWFLVWREYLTRNKESKFFLSTEFYFSNSGNHYIDVAKRMHYFPPSNASHPSCPQILPPPTYQIPNNIFLPAIYHCRRPSTLAVVRYFFPPCWPGVFA